MKVIREPVPVSWSIEKECIANVATGEVGCEALLEVDISDIYIKNKLKAGWSEFYEESYTYAVQLFTFRCPCCGKETSIKDSEIPEKVRKIIQNREREKNNQSLGQKKLNKI